MASPERLPATNPACRSPVDARSTHQRLIHMVSVHNIPETHGAHSSSTTLWFLS